MNKRVRSLIASIILIAMLMGMVPATELSVFAASCTNAGYSGGAENPFVQGTTLGVDYTVAAGYYDTSKNAATAAMQEWGQKDANRYPVDPDATEVTRSIVAATTGSPMYLHHTGTSASGNNMSRTYGWVSNFAKDDGRYYAAADVQYLVMVYRTPGRTSGGSDMQAYWAVSKSGSYAEDYDWFTNTRGLDGIDISDLCYDNYLKPDSGLVDFGWKAEGVHSTGILSSMSFHLTCSGEWTYAVINMMQTNSAYGIGGTYYGFYDTFAADGNTASTTLIGNNSKYLSGDCVAGVGLALPIAGSSHEFDISHIAYFSTQDAAQAFGESAVAFDNNPGTYNGDTVTLSQTTKHQAPTVFDQYLATFVPTNTWGKQSSVIDGTWVPQNYYSSKFNYELTVESAQLAVENVTYGGVPSRRIYGAPDSEWRWPSLDAVAKTNLADGSYDGKWLTTDPRNLSAYQGTDKSANAGTDIRYIRYITLVYETLSIDDTDIGIGFRRYESDSNDQRVGFWDSGYKGGTDSTFWLDFPESTTNQNSSTGEYASPNYQVVTYDLLEWVEKYGKTSLESFNANMWKFNGISLSFNGMDQTYSTYNDSVCVAYCDFFTEETEAQLQGQQVQAYLNSYSTDTANSVVNTVTYTANENYAHNYSTVVTAPTCTEGGYTTYTCSECGYSYVGDKTSSKGHDSVAVVTAPTCTQAGYTTYTCSVCGDSYTGNSVNPTGHSYVNQVCTVCGSAMNFEGLTLSILGDSISTYMGVSNNTDYNSTIGENNVHYDGVNYNPNVALSDTWWMQTINTLGMRLLVNNSWSGSKIWKWAWYTDGAYLDRCVQLHNDHTGEEPDIIAIFLGTNDFIGQESGALGTEAAINYSSLITKSGSGYTYAEPTTVCEAYAIMVHKAMIRYPDAEFYCFTILPSRKYIDEGIEGLADFNASIKAIAQHFGANIVDLYEKSGIEIDDGRVFDKNHWYTSHETVHPDPGGMDAITGTFLSSLYTNSKYNMKEVSNVTYDLADDVIVKEGTAYAVLKGESFTCSFMSLNNTGAQATVTMDGKNITAEVYKDGVITIPEVTGDIHISAKEGTPHSYKLVVTEPTCTVAGNTSYVCSTCGDAYVVSETTTTGHSYSSVVTAPTCGAQGYTTHTCSNCGDSYVNSYVPALEHSYSSVVTAPTCEDRGYTTYTCSVCGDSYVADYVAAKGHSWVAATCTDAKYCSVCKATEGNALGHSYKGVITAPTCTDQGYTTYTCATCKDSYVADYVAAKGHTWVAATCTDAKYCSVCKATEGNALGHNYGKVVTAPTCTAGGYTTYTCATCGDSYIDDEVGALGHTWVAATCTEAKYCSVCRESEGDALGHIDANTDHICDRKCGKTDIGTHGDSATDKDHVCDYGCGEVLESCSDAPGDRNHNCDICGAADVTNHSYGTADCESPATCTECGAATGGALGHDYNAVVTKPTCTAGGYTTYTCERCGDTYTGNQVAATGHTEKVVSGYAATCTEAGLTDGVICAVCDATITAQEAISATGHTEEVVPGYAADCGNTGLTDGVKCSVCGATLTKQEVIPANGHSYTKVVTKPTCTEDGYTTYTCDLCGDTYTDDEVAATGHTDGNQDIRCDTCGALIKPAHLRSLSLSLAGKIGINYYMLLSDQVLADQTAYMQFRLVDGEIIRIPVAEGIKKVFDNETYYVFTCYVSAKEMTDDVVSQFFYAGGSTEASTFNVKYYAEETLRTSNDEDLKNLIRTMLNYGAAAQNNFGYNTDNLAGEVLDYSDVTIDGYTIDADQGTDLAQFYAASLILKSSTTLRFFFLVDSSVENFTATYNGQKLEVNQRSGLYYVDVVGISAQDLDKDVTITIHDGSFETDVSFNPMAYCQGVSNDTTDAFDQNLKNLVAALYLYNQAAIKYFEGGNAR